MKGFINDCSCTICLYLRETGLQVTKVLVLIMKTDESEMVEGADWTTSHLCEQTVLMLHCYLVRARIVFRDKNYVVHIDMG